MEQQRKVTTIPASISRYTETPIDEQHKRKVAAYARVSTDHEDQVTSYEAQIDFYSNYIKSRNDWEFVDVYTDEGISGTSTKRRKGFRQMITDALAGKIDLIITKSVSRFARNTVDSLSTIRKLKDKGVECYFEKENIWTFDGKGELLLTIMSSLAQEESRSISQNCTWGQRKRFADGKASVAYKRFLGYDKGPDGTWTVNEEQAKTVQMIYRLFLEGYSYRAIANALEEKGLKSPGGRDKWSVTTVRSILTNEKYKGDALLQKRFTVDFLTKKSKENEGEVPQYYVENHHPAIIPRETFDLVQSEVVRRAKGMGRYNGVSIFSAKIRCGDCGNWYGSKVWHSNDKYRKVIWQCNHKYSDKGHTCQTPHVTSDEIEQAFVKAMNEYASEKDEVISRLKEAQKLVSDISALEQEKDRKAAEVNAIADLIQNAIAENARKAQDQTEYTRRYNDLVSQYDTANAEYTKLEDEIKGIHARSQELTRLIKEAGNLGLIDGFDKGMWGLFVDYVTMQRDGTMVFTMKDGIEIEA